MSSSLNSFPNISGFDEDNIIEKSFKLLRLSKRIFRLVKFNSGEIEFG